jgi:predicted double-glycine peptidase
MRTMRKLAVIFGTIAWCAAAGCAAFQPDPRPVEKPGKPQRHTLKQLRDQYVVKQELDYSCGSAAMATLMLYYFGEPTSERAILDKLFAPLSEKQKKVKAKKGFSLLDLRNVAQTMGYQAAGFRLPVHQLPKLSAPVIVHLEGEGYKHFAVLRGLSWRRVYLADPARGNLRMSLDRFLDEWKGIIFVLGKKDEDKIKNYPLAIHHNTDYGQPELVNFGGQMDRGMFLSMLPLRRG